MAIETLKVENFKRFESGAFELASPVTVLVGPNSSGKSSIIKALVALKQTVSSANEHEVLASNGDYVDLGTYQDYVFSHDVTRNVAFEVVFSRKFSDLPWLFDRKTEASGKIRIRIELDHDRAANQARLVRVTTQHLSNSGEELAGLDLTRKRTRPSFWLAPSRELSARLDKTFGSLRTRDYAPGFNRTASAAHSEKYRFNPADGRAHDLFPLFWVLNSALEGLSEVLERYVYYVGPLRSSPSRSYTRTTHSLAVGPTGEHTPSVLANLEHRKRKATTGESEYRSRHDLFTKWLEIVFPGTSVSTRNLEELVKVVVKNDQRRSSDAISDVGFGLSQALPIILQAAVMPKDAILVAEQPELHLHPVAQAAFAEVLVEAAMSGRKLLVETHSEHLIRGLQLAIAKQNADESEVNLSGGEINFLYVPAMPKSPCRLRLANNGAFIDQWPTGFFDKSYQLALALLNAQSS